jgi:hypothetical protein
LPLLDDRIIVLSSRSSTILLSIVHCTHLSSLLLGQVATTMFLFIGFSSNVLLHLHWLAHFGDAASSVFSIYDTDPYKALRDCGKLCYNNGDAPADQLSCMDNRVDSCICRPDLQGLETNHLSSCVKTKCDNTVDIIAAVTVYLDYCHRAGYTEVSSTPTTQESLSTTPPIPSVSLTDQVITTSVPALSSSPISLSGTITVAQSTEAAHTSSVISYTLGI